MRKDENQRKRKEQDLMLNDTAHDKIKREMRVIEENKAKDATKLSADAQKRQSFLINKITQIFREREVSFYDAFISVYDPMIA